jgi:ubiquinone/menaquinone biosynthesis C-methylase UbiE
MIAAAKAAAAEAGVAPSLIHARFEEFTAARTFDIITIGRALHWLDRTAALPVLERIISECGRSLICGARSVETPATPWMKPYEDVRHGWPSDTERKRYRLEAKEWFTGSCFNELATTSVTESRQGTIADLVSRTL